MKRSTHFRLSEEALARLDEEARHRGLTRTAVIETLLRSLPPISSSQRSQHMGRRIGQKLHTWGDAPLVGRVTDVYEVTEEVDDLEDPQRTRFAWKIQGEGAAADRTWSLISGMTIYPPDPEGYTPILTRLVLALGIFTEEELHASPLPERDLDTAIGRRLQFELEGPYTISTIDLTTLRAVPEEE